MRATALLSVLLPGFALALPATAQNLPPVAPSAVQLAEPAGDPAVILAAQAFAAVRGCWNVTEGAALPTVALGFEMHPDGVPDAGSIRLLRHEGQPDAATRQAYDAARRAIIRCGAGGFKLPPENFAQWRSIEMTFNPERMRNQ